MTGTDMAAPPINADTGLQSQSPQQKLAEFIGDVLHQLSFLQGVASAHISEIAALEEKVAAQRLELDELMGFKKFLKLRLRQQTENQI